MVSCLVEKVIIAIGQIERTCKNTKMRFNNAWCYRSILLSKGFFSAIWHARRNVIAYEHKLPPFAGPYMAELDITYQCNCRCRMCQRWRHSRQESLVLADYQKLASDFKRMGGVHQISIAGGEPLMRKDVVPIISAFSSLGMSVNLCTNGILLEKYCRDICNTGVTCITVSLDGATAETHDAIRGMQGSYRHIEKGIEAIIHHHRANRPVLRVRMTITNQNQHEIQAFYLKWRRIADDVLLQPVHYCHDSYYTGLTQNDLELDSDMISSQIRGTLLEKGDYLQQLVTSLKETGMYPKQHCYAGVLMARIDPWGNVYPCLEQHVCVGSLHHQDFDTIWKSDVLTLERERIKSDRPCNCWYNNTALIGHYGMLLGKTGLMVLKKTVQKFSEFGS